jgi:hypothetical protein
MTEDETAPDGTVYVPPALVPAVRNSTITMPQSNTKLYELFTRPLPIISEVEGLTVHGDLFVECVTTLEQTL